MVSRLDRVVQYGECSDSTLMLKPASRRLGSREKVTKMKSMLDMAEWEGLKHDCEGYLSLQVSAKANSEEPPESGGAGWCNQRGSRA